MVAQRFYPKQTKKRCIFEYRTRGEEDTEKTPIKPVKVCPKKARENALFFKGSVALA